AFNRCASRALCARVSAPMVIQARSGTASTTPCPDTTTTDSFEGGAGVWAAASAGVAIRSASNIAFMRSASRSIVRRNGRTAHGCEQRSSHGRTPRLHSEPFRLDYRSSRAGTALDRMGHLKVAPTYDERLTDVRDDRARPAARDAHACEESRVRP